MVLLACIDADCGGVAVSPEWGGYAAAAGARREATCSSCGRAWPLTDSILDVPFRL
ncbi:hypothetical protein ACPEEZ_14880 [Frigoribacterium sp. 2-23]|uniref:hypothetical protein n=1 Tax=Frigoribacterium sp. 2-23 TaxID=3415006 RepID=UPI003C705806